MFHLFTKAGRIWGDFRVEGRRIRRPLATSKGAAAVLAADFERRLAIEESGGAPARDLTVAEVVASFLRDRKQTTRSSTLGRYEEVLENIKEWLTAHGVANVRDLTLEKVLEYRESRLAEKMSARTANYEASALKWAIEYSVRSGRLPRNPLAGLRLLKGPKVRIQRPLSLSEGKRLLEVSPEPWRSAYEALLFGGFRSGELRTLEWQDIDLGKGLARVGFRVLTKTGKAREVSLATPILARLREWKLQRKPKPGDPVFLGARDGKRLNARYLRRRLDLDLEVAKIDQKGRYVHALRGTCSQWLHESGAAPHAVSGLLGHSVAVNGAFYLARSRDAETAAVAVLSKVLETVPNGHPGGTTNSESPQVETA